MEFTKDEIFNIKYCENENVLKLKGKSWFKKLLKGNNFIKLIVITTVLFGLLNIILIYNFFSILMKM